MPILFPIVRDFKDNDVGNVVAETARDFVFMTAARLSDLSMSLNGEVRRSPEQSARQPIARSGKYVRRAYSRRAFDCEKTKVLCFSHRGGHFCLRGDWGKRGDLTWQPAVKHQCPAAKATNSNCCDCTMAQVIKVIQFRCGKRQDTISDKRGIHNTRLTRHNRCD